jgi:allophycocyanin alpha subunit
MSIITKIIINADADIRYLTPGELEEINLFIKSSDRRLRIVKTLTTSRDRIVKEAASQLFQRSPNLVSPGGNAYGKELDFAVNLVDNHIQQ